MARVSKRKREGEEVSDESSDSETSESGSDQTDLANAALHTIWDVEDAKNVLQMIAEKPDLTVFAAIRSQWGKGLEVQNAVNAHMESMSESPDAEPYNGNSIFLMLEGTRELAEELQHANEFEAAFFFAHAAADMIRGCEGDEADEGEVIEWAKALDTVMAEAVKGWHAQSGDGKKAKQDAATLVKLLEKGKRAENCDQEKWYPVTFKALGAWTK